MSSHRFWIAGIIAWMFLFMSIPVMFSAIVIHAWVFPLIGLFAFCGLLLPGKHLIWLASFTCLAYALAVSYLGTSNSSFWLIETAIEISGILIGGALLRKANDSFQQYEEKFALILMMEQGLSIKSEEMVFDQMKRELSRARRYERHLSLVSIEPIIETSPKANSQHLIEEMLGRLHKQLIKGQLAELFTSQTKANDIISYREGQFLIMLPETDKAQAKAMAQRVLTLCDESLKISVQTETASFPCEEFTLSGLIKRTLKKPQTKVSLSKIREPLELEGFVPEMQEDVLQQT
ncbi:hypothetical protein MNBD_PLANCTO02-1131 [hydrothermal vent metagenome]|uniref:GGDEF domain-containing protein n=1 Tax=hydrothermal vent metagenome TaxID=652676 RepID=A0A3B1DFM0_9ZZZZ